MRNRHSPRGQMLVIVAVALTALIAMAGLIVDGGMAWSNRRQAQNAADAASLAGTRVLGLDLKWRASGSPGTAPFANPDASVCDAINNALDYNENTAQEIDPIDCYAGSPDATYVNFDRVDVGQVGDGIPFTAQGVRVRATGNSNTFLMGVVGISTIDVNGDAIALAGPAEPPLGKLMPFVVQNPLGPFVPGTPYEIRSESEGECGALAPAEPEFADAGIVFASYVEPSNEKPAPLAAKPLTPIANPGTSNFGASITVTLSTNPSGLQIVYTTDGSTPQKNKDPVYSAPLTFTATTTLKAVALDGNQSSDVGTFVYTQNPPPQPVVANPASGTTFATTQSVSLTTPTAGAEIRYTTDGSTPSTGSTLYSSALTLDSTTQIRAIAVKDGIASTASTFTYLKSGETGPVTASPVDGTTFESGLTVTLTSTTPGATIYYTTDGSAPDDTSSEYSGPISIFATTTIRAFATLDDNDGPISGFTYTKISSSCPDSTAGNFGWVDFSGGAGSNKELKDWVDDPSTAPVDWYYTICGGSSSKNCRAQHIVDDPADDHWLLEGTTGHRDITLDIACKYVGQEIYVPIWDSFETTAKKPNGANAVFHLIGFAVFKLDGVIDTKPDGSASGKGCGVQDIDGSTKGKDKGFIGTYVDSFIGSQVAPCIASPDGTNPCANLGANTAFTINLAK